MMAGGRPTKYKPEYCDTVIEHMTKGKSIRSFAAHCDVDEDTVHEWIKVHPQFSGAVRRGKQKAYAWWEEQALTGLWDSSVVENGADGSVTKSFSKINSRMFEICMQNMFGWSRKLAPSDEAVKAQVTTESVSIAKAQLRKEMGLDDK